MSIIKTTGINNLKDIVNLFMSKRVDRAMEKKLTKNKRYNEMKEKCDGLEEQVSSFLAEEEQKEVFSAFCNSIGDLISEHERFAYRRGMIDAYRIRDIIIGISHQ
jgi:hypothetical protein